MPTIKPLTYNLGNPDDYNPIILSRRSESDLRDEYRRLRKVALDRIRKIEKSSDFGDSAIVTNNKSWLSVKPADVRAADLPSALSNLASLLEAKTSTLGGLRRQRARSLETLREHGIKGINKANWGEYTKFMVQSQVFKEAFIPYPKRSKGSEALDAARQIRPKMFSLIGNGNISQNAILTNFEFFKENLTRIEKLVRQKNSPLNTKRKRPYSANEIRKMLGMEPEPQISLKQAKERAKGGRS